MAGFRAPAARRRRARPRASTHAGEGSRGGAAIPFLLQFAGALLLLPAAEREGIGEMRLGKGRNDLGFQGPAGGRGFVAPICARDRPIASDGHDQPGQVGPRGRFRLALAGRIGRWAE